jgi:N-acylglucosamine-6-phosphate 2-epimerase
MSRDRNFLESLRGGLIVSVQARTGSALDDPNVLAAIAGAAKEAGAVALRAAGEHNLKAIRKRVELPIIGIVKREYPGYEPYITPTLREVREITGCSAEVVAFDVTGRPRPGGLGIAAIVEEIQGAGALAMADCATAADGVAAQAAGADIVATTLCGYTKETAGCVLPALGLVRELGELDAFVICEGGIHSPAQAAAALEAGADAIVVGTAITNVEWLVQQFAEALKRSSRT